MEPVHYYPSEAEFVSPARAIVILAKLKNQPPCYPGAEEWISPLRAWLELEDIAKGKSDSYPSWIGRTLRHHMRPSRRPGRGSFLSNADDRALAAKEALKVLESGAEKVVSYFALSNELRQLLVDKLRSGKLCAWGTKPSAPEGTAAELIQPSLLSGPVQLGLNCIFNEFGARDVLFAGVLIKRQDVLDLHHPKGDELDNAALKWMRDAAQDFLQRSGLPPKQRPLAQDCKAATGITVRRAIKLHVQLPEQLRNPRRS